MDESLQHLYLSGDKSRHIPCLVRDASAPIRPENLPAARGCLQQNPNQNKQKTKTRVIHARRDESRKTLGGRLWTAVRGWTPPMRHGVK